MSILTESNSERERQQRQQNQSNQAMQRSRLLHKLLAPNPDIRQFIADLVYIQAVTVAGTEAAAFILEPGKEEGEANLINVAHIRPDQSEEGVRQQALKAFADIATTCIRENKNGAIDVGNADMNSEKQYCLVTLLRAENGIVAVTAVITRCRDEARARQRLESMELVAGYFDFYLLRRGHEQTKIAAQNHQDVLQYMTAIGNAEGYQNAINNLCNEIAARTGATRVSVGWVHGVIAPKIKLKGLSHTEQFDKKQELSVQLVRTMEECYDQEEIVQYDPNPTTNLSTANVTREAQQLSRMEGGSRVTSLPLRHREEMVGVISIEFPQSKPPSDEEATGLAVATSLLGAPLYDRHYGDRWLITKAGISTKNTLKMLLGKKYWLAKLLIMTALLALWFVGGAPVPFSKPLYVPMHNVKAPFAFAPIDRRVVSMPFDAKLIAVNKLPNDMVKVGDVLAELDTKEISAKLAAATAQKSASEKQARILENQRDENGQPRTAEAYVEYEKAKEAQAQIELYAGQMEKSKIRATIDGEILQQDLRERLNDTLKQGEQLFEIAPMTGNLRAEISVSDRDIQRVQVGKQGTLRTAARPDLEFPFTVEKIIPSAKPEAGKNVFTVYARFDQSIKTEDMNAWRAGMKGEARIENEPKPLIWQWTYRLVEWVRMTVWKYQFWD
ncbi:MAG TPA: HlyD family efflux transporter periplasmic adaptor subunit [Tepidisphaeraceae bacterium]|nr:HlyD family efflux transporter periplasmic adaptor subunit [Tepidisphaeraceae bacterium]